MLRRFIAWLDRKTIAEQISYAGAQYALALSCGDARRAARLKLIINKLKEHKN
jgi:hypothetical protein